MKNLIIVRHAKSSWDTPLTDKKRTLADRGIKDAYLVSSNIAPHLPDRYLIWSSTARRAAETAMIFAKQAAYAVDDIIFRDDLYTFDVIQLNKTIQSCPDDYDCVMLFGHNEAITDFVNKFGDIRIDNVPTTGFVSMVFDTGSWRDIKHGRVQKTVFPNDLKDK